VEEPSKVGRSHHLKKTKDGRGKKIETKDASRKKVQSHKSEEALVSAGATTSKKTNREERK